MSLLSNAEKIEAQVKQRKRQSFDTDEHKELALAWLRSEIGYTALSQALYPKAQRLNQNGYIAVAIGLRRAYRQGELVEVRDGQIKTKQ